MSNLITTIEHAYATAIGDLKKAGATIKNDVLPILQKIENSGPAIEQVSAAINPVLVNIERVGEAALGKIIQLLEDGDTAIVSGLTTALGVDIVNDVKAIAPAVISQAQASGLTASVPKS
jgi:GTP-sensing pleiotropic transcriptional regulator CodY